jgi:hypothetical protein
MMSLRAHVLFLVTAVSACSGGGVSPNLDGGADAGKQIRLSGLPDCGTPADAGTVSDIYANVVIPYGCASGGCHAAGAAPNHFGVTDPATFRARMLESSEQVPGLPRVTPGDIHKSYVIYKLWGQHADAGYEGTGERMPYLGPYLTDPEFCAVVGWVQAGAP